PAEMRQADTPVQRQPAGGSELILQEDRFHVSPQRLAMAQRRSAAVTGNDSEELVIALAKHLEAGTGIVTPADDADLRDAALVVRATVDFRNHRCISRVAVELPNVMSAIEVVEGRDRDHSALSDGMQPGEIHQRIAFFFHVANAEGLLIRI